MSDAADASYGADPNGLICGFLFEAGGSGRAIASDSAAEWLAPGERATGSFLWLHLNLAVSGAERWLRAHAGLPQPFLDAIQGGASRSSRVEALDDALIAVLNDVTFDFAFEPADVATLWMAVRPGLVVSARRQPLRAVDRLRTAVRHGAPIGSPTALLVHLMGDQAEELVRIVRSASDRVDTIEDELLAGRLHTHALELGRLRRLMVRLQRLLVPEPAALFRFLGRPPAWIGDDDVQALRQASEEFAVVLRDVAALQERIKLLQEEAAARVADQNNRSLFVLTTVTVLALPINLIAGLLGMNVGGIPMSDRPYGFLVVVLVIAALTGGLAYFALRRLRQRD